MSHAPMKHTPTTDRSENPSGPVALAPAAGYLSVPVGELDDLLRYLRNQQHGQMDEASHDAINASKSLHIAAAKAYADAAERLHLLLVDAKTRQPTDNAGDEPRANERRTKI